MFYCAVSELAIHLDREFRLAPAAASTRIALRISSWIAYAAYCWYWLMMLERRQLSCFVPPGTYCICTRPLTDVVVGAKCVGEVIGAKCERRCKVIYCTCCVLGCKYRYRYFGPCFERQPQVQSQVAYRTMSTIRRVVQQQEVR
jgi:hypothetical protein